MQGEGVGVPWEAGISGGKLATRTILLPKATVLRHPRYLTCPMYLVCGRVMPLTYVPIHTLHTHLPFRPIYLDFRDLILVQ